MDKNQELKQLLGRLRRVSFSDPNEAIDYLLEVFVLWHKGAEMPKDRARELAVAIKFDSFAELKALIDFARGKGGKKLEPDQIVVGDSSDGNRLVRMASTLLNSQRKWSTRELAQDRRRFIECAYKWLGN